MTLRGEGISFEFLRTLPPCLVFGGDINAALKSNALGAHEVAGVLTGGVRGITSTLSSLPPKAAVTGEETTARFEGESPSWSLTENSEPSGDKSVWSSCTLSSISKVRLNSSISFVCSTSQICSEVVKIAALSTQSARVSDSVGSTEIAASCTFECTPTAERSTSFSTVFGSTDSGLDSPYSNAIHSHFFCSQRFSEVGRSAYFFLLVEKAVLDSDLERDDVSRLASLDGHDSDSVVFDGLDSNSVVLNTMNSPGG
nr:hypothetical protein Iba_chr07fCG5770 [Ipomoea batatas]